MKKIVTKFGGSSLADAGQFRKVKDILLLDEPMNALDKDGVALVKSILTEHIRQGKTLIFTSHNQEDMDDLAQVRYEIDRGEVRERSMG